MNPPAPDIATTALTVARFASETGARCPACRAPLSSLVGDRCPSCYQALLLRLGAPPTRLFVWLGGVIPSTMGTGVFLLLLGVAVFQNVHFRSGDLPFFAQAINVPIAALYLACRRRFQRLPHGTQLLLAALTIVVTAIPLSFFIARL